MEYSLFHIQWNFSSTYCGRDSPHYVEDVFHNMWNIECCVVLQLIPRLFAANSVDYLHKVVLH